MVLSYFSHSKKSKASGDIRPSTAEGERPVLSHEDEEFLAKIAAESAAPSNPEQPTIILDNGKKVRGTDAQVALMDGADQVPLPSSPPEEIEGGGIKARARSYLSYVHALPSGESWRAVDWSPYIPSIRRNRSDRGPPTAKIEDKTDAGDAALAAEQVEKADSADEDELIREQDDLTAVLDQLNLSARNNRVFSVTKESQRLMADFTLILKDIYNGAPTAYDDLESFLTRKNKEITGMFDNLPPWLQTLVKSLPAKLTAGLAPEVLATASSEKPGFDAKMAAATAGDGAKKQSKSRIPSLKSLLAQQGAVAGMLRSILNFLKLRFPAFLTGTNVLMSLAVFLLLFVFWYCHKRGRETRLERERSATAGDTLDPGPARDGRAGDDDGGGESSDGEGVTDMEGTTVLESGEGGGNQRTLDERYARGVVALGHSHPKDVPLPADGGPS